MCRRCGQRRRHRDCDTENAKRADLHVLDSRLSMRILAVDSLACAMRQSQQRTEFIPRQIVAVHQPGSVFPENRLGRRLSTRFQIPTALARGPVDCEAQKSVHVFWCPELGESRGALPSSSENGARWFPLARQPRAVSPRECHGAHARGATLLSMPDCY